MTRRLKIGSWNVCNGIATKMDYVKNALTEYDLDVLFIQEAEISETLQRDLYNIKGYTIEMCGCILGSLLKNFYCISLFLYYFLLSFSFTFSQILLCPYVLIFSLISLYYLPQTSVGRESEGGYET